MSKLQTLLLQILGCVVLGIILGTAFRWFDGGKTHKKASVASGGHPNAQKMASVKVYQGKSVWDTIKIGESWRTVEYLEVMK